MSIISQFKKKKKKENYIFSMSTDLGPSATIYFLLLQKQGSVGQMRKISYLDIKNHKQIIQTLLLSPFTRYFPGVQLPNRLPFTSDTRAVRRVGSYLPTREGSVVKNPPANAGDTGSIPGLGRSHMLRDDCACAPQLLSLCCRAREPQLLTEPK